jgi:ubiquinone/menaquinone biosynthesis C-methylase UbiE
VSPPESIAALYDGVAGEYDRLVAEDGWMRRTLWRRYRQLFAPGGRLLDVACGTGLDTLHLARHGFQLHGIDASPGMVEELRRKAEGEGLTEAIEVQVADLARLGGRWPEGTFDGMLSAFAGLNTVPDLGAFATEAARLLRPGGRALFHFLTPSGIWDRLPAYLRLRFAEGRRLARRRERWVEVEGHGARHTLWPPREAYAHCFEPHFQALRLYTVGFLWPRKAGRVLPAAVADPLGCLEVQLGSRWPCLQWGRFAVLELERRSVTD